MMIEDNVDNDDSNDDDKVVGDDDDGAHIIVVAVVLRSSFSSRQVRNSIETVDSIVVRSTLCIIAEAILSRNQDGIELAIDPGTYVVTPGTQIMSLYVLGSAVMFV